MIIIIIVLIVGTMVHSIILYTYVDEKVSVAELYSRAIYI